MSVRAPTIWLAITPLLFLITQLACAVAVFGDDASSGPNQISLLLSTAVACLVGQRLGFRWADLEQAIIDGIALAMKACIILLAIGSLIGSWMLSGTAPAMIDLGLGLLDASVFFPAALIICAVVSAAIGSSWTTAGTIGVALIGISQVFGLSPAMTAGAVISGAYFGDKMSPLSDSTNLAPAMVGADLFEHIRHMFWTTIPAFAIALLLFAILGLDTPTTTVTVATIDATRLVLQSHYNLGLVAYLPLLILVGLAIARVPALPTIVAGTVAACLVAGFFQPGQIWQTVGPDNHGVLAAFETYWSVLATGYESNTGLADLDDLLSRGGMASMLNTVWLIVAAMSFGGVMEHTGCLHKIAAVLLSWVRGTRSLIATTVFTSIGFNIVAADQYIAIVLPGRMFKLEYAKYHLAPVNLSRTLEDGGTMTSALVPWNTCGAFMAGTLGVSTLDYLPYAFLNLASPVLAIAFGMLNIGIKRVSTSDGI